MPHKIGHSRIYVYTNIFKVAEMKKEALLFGERWSKETILRVVQIIGQVPFAQSISVTIEFTLAYGFELIEVDNPSCI